MWQEDDGSQDENAARDADEEEDDDDEDEDSVRQDHCSQRICLFCSSIPNEMLFDV